MGNAQFSFERITNYALQHALVDENRVKALMVFDFLRNNEEDMTDKYTETLRAVIKDHEASVGSPIWKEVYRYLEGIPKERLKQQLNGLTIPERIKQLEESIEMTIKISKRSEDTSGDGFGYPLGPLGVSIVARDRKRIEYLKQMQEKGY